MRIALVAPRVGFDGPLERYTYEVAAGLRARGHEMLLLHGPESGRDPEAFVAPFHAVAPINGAARLGRVDVAYVQQGSYATELAAFARVPMVFAAHDHAHTCVRGDRYLPFEHKPCHRAPGGGCVNRGCILVSDPESVAGVALVSPFALRRRTRGLGRRGVFVACSRYVAGHLIDAGVEPSRVHVVHPVLAEDPRPQEQVPSEVRVLVVSQLLRGNGVDLAIEAFAHLPHAPTLEVVGDGPTRGALEALAQERAPGRVRFHGFIPAEEITRFYDTSAVVVLPSSRPEPFGMVGIEAMRRARPVVGAAHGGIPEWLKHGEAGRLFRPGDARGLARAIESVLSEPGAGLRARRYATEHFTYEGTLDALERVLYAAQVSIAA